MFVYKKSLKCKEEEDNVLKYKSLVLLIIMSKIGKSWKKTWTEDVIVAFG